MYSFLATDERIVRPANYPARLPGGTAYLTDVGMPGPLESVIGVRTEIIVRRFLTELPALFEVAGGAVRLDAALITAEGGRATAIEAFEARPVASADDGAATACVLPR